MMEIRLASFAVSFRIGGDSGYAERYKSVTEKIKSLSITSTWEETTSFYLVTYNGTAQGFADAVYFGSGMSGDRDALLVIEIGGKNYGTQGNISYPATLGSFFK